RGADRLADPTQLARFARHELEAERARIGDRVPHAPERDVDVDRSDAFDVERGVELRDERRHVGELDALDAAVAARAAHLDDARRRLQQYDRLRLAQL